MIRSRRLPAGLALAALALTGCPAADEGGTGGAHTGPGSALPLSESVPRFEDRTTAAGIDFRMTFLRGEQGENFKINLYDHGCGVAIGDVDGDGYDDLYFTNQLGGNALFRNRGDGTFENVTARSPGLDLPERISVAAVFNDYDGDGDQDLFVTSTRGGNALFRNDGDLTFTNVTEAAGVAHVGHTQGATFFDPDGDGDLDLYVTNTAGWTTAEYNEADRYYVGVGTIPALVESEIEFNILYRNDGDGTFTDVTEQAGVAGRGWGGDTAVFDFDEDGDQDLFVTNMFGRSQLFRNDGELRFTDVTAETLGKTSWGAIGSRAFDYDGDGRLDLCIADMHSDMWMEVDTSRSVMQPTRKFDGVTGAMREIHSEGQALEAHFATLYNVAYDEVLFGNSLFRNLGGGKFEETSDAANFETLWPWGVATGDFDNDLDEDVFLPSGMGYPYFFWPNSMLVNDGDGTFHEGHAEAGVEPPLDGRFFPERMREKRVPRSSRCAAVADFDKDGRLDLVVNNFNDRPYLYMNTSTPRSWLRVRLAGTSANCDAVGAVVRMTVGGKRLVRLVQAAGGYLSQESKTLHFGLGDAEVATDVVVTWPDGTRQEIGELAAGQEHRIEQP